MLRKLSLRNVSWSIRSNVLTCPLQSVSNRTLGHVLRLEPPVTAFNAYPFLQLVRNIGESAGFSNKAAFEEVCDETLDSLTDKFEELVENADHLAGADVNYSDGVLTVQFGEPHGTYVINRQSPNQQIWLSSPSSGPKRYDFINSTWVYRHDNVSLHELLQLEISKIIRTEVDFKQCKHSQ